MSFNIKTIGSDGIVGNHPDVTNWLNTISLVGGSASSTTISALNTFCNSIDAAGLRNKFYRLNLFCGNNLASCLVPLFGRPTSSGPEYGNGVDQNVGFVESDYTETGANGGLKGNGSTKHLRPRLIVSRETGNESVGCYVTQEATSATPAGTYYLIGSHSPSNNNRSLGILYYSNQYNIEDGSLGISPNGVWATSLGQAVGFRCASSNGLSSRKMYLNGSVVWSNTDTATAAVNAISPYLFARSDSGNGYGLGNQRMAGYFIGTSMTDADIANLNNAMQTFQTALLRHRASADPIFSSITNADAQLWIDNAYANGGSVSLSTATAVNTFCNSIDSAGIRDRFYRLNLFCGDNLFAALVPLYRGQSSSGTNLGNNTDTPVNFVSTDYTETGSTGGLNTQNSFSRYLNIGTISSMDAASQHISNYVRLRSGQTNLGGFGINIAGSGWETRIQYRSALAGRAWIGAQFWGGTFSPTSTVTQTTFVLCSRTSSSNMFVHFNGVANGSDTETRTIPASSSASVTVCSQSAGSYLDGIIAAYSFGLGMTTSQAQDFNAAMQTFQTSLGRNV